MYKLKRAEKKFSDAASPSKPLEPPKKGHPVMMHSPLSITDENAQRIMRSIHALKMRGYVFQCPQANIGELHRAESDAMGRRYLFIKLRTECEKVKKFPGSYK